jgi:hypothetical protein
MKIRFRIYKLQKIIFFIVFTFFNSFEINAQLGGSATYDFLNLTSSARIAAMGGKIISLSDNDLNLVFQNPSSLNPSMSKNIALNYNDYLAGIGFGNAIYAFQAGAAKTIAIGAQYIDYGTFQDADVYGNLYGKFYAKDIALNFTFSQIFDTIFQVGVNIKPVFSFYERYSSVGIAADIGALYHSPNGNFSVGLVFRNIGTQIKSYTTTYENLPFEIEAGISQKLAHAPFRFSLTFHNLQRYKLYFDSKLDNAADPTASSDKSKAEKFFDNFFRHVIGSVEFLPSRTFYIAGAYNYQRKVELSLKDSPGMVGFSFGVGIHTQKITLSYGHAFYHAAGGTNNFSIQLNMGNILHRD